MSRLGSLFLDKVKTEINELEYPSAISKRVWKRHVFSSTRYFKSKPAYLFSGIMSSLSFWKSEKQGCSVFREDKI